MATTGTFFQECERISEVLYRIQCDEILLPIRRNRRRISGRRAAVPVEAVKSHSIYKEEDTVVPRAELPRLPERSKSDWHQLWFP